jgi:hypothetical protein
MALKDTVKTLEEVDEAHRPLYVADKEVGFKLDVEGREDPAELRRAKTRESEGRKAAEKKVADMEAAQTAKDEEARLAREDAAKKAGDVESLQKSWKEKYDTDLALEAAKHKPVIDSLESDVTRLLIDNEAHSIASGIALPGSEGVLFPHVRNRLRVEMRDGKRTTVVVDTEGKASAMTLDELKKEFVANKAFAPVLAASRASGGGANGGKGGGATDKTLFRAEFEALSPAARAAHFKSGGTVVDPP